jgi:hypothetical protein
MASRPAHQRPPYSRRGLRAYHRRIWEFVEQSAADAWGIGVPVGERPHCRPTRAHRRGHDIEWGDFLPSDDWHRDNGYTDAEFAAAGAGYLAWLGTLAAVAAHTESMAAPACRPHDEPAPVEPLDWLTPISPNAPSYAVVREARAA